MRHPEHQSWCAVTHGYNACTCALSTAEPTDCPCECHKPKHEARQPSPLTMIGRKR